MRKRSPDLFACIAICAPSQHQRDTYSSRSSSVRNRTDAVPFMMYCASSKRCWTSFQRTTCWFVLRSYRVGIWIMVGDDSARNACKYGWFILRMEWGESAKKGRRKSGIGWVVNPWNFFDSCVTFVCAKNKSRGKGRSALLSHTTHT